ncbi:MAG: Holliday junction branch migration protein RuvA [Verrucomicrobia bacterium]|nr:Holliday junction branch migration protein RuvA [Verrucomicrobiota bacterium]
MYEYIKGTLTEVTPLRAVIETGGLGYSILIPFNHFGKLPLPGATVHLFLSYVVREDSQRLFGFLTRHERDLFETLIEISGIGPKIALALIGHMESDQLKRAISQGQTQTICKIPGIGKKTAERLVVEMRDKIKKSFSIAEGVSETGLVGDAISALINLGYGAPQAEKAIQKALSQCEKEPHLATLITAALRSI